MLSPALRASRPSSFQSGCSSRSASCAEPVVRIASARTRSALPEPTPNHPTLAAGAASRYTGANRQGRTMTDLSETPVELARDLIRCPSITPVDAGALDVLERALAHGGFHCRRLTFPENSTPPVDNLFARIGWGPPHLCLGGHPEVVPRGDGGLWTYPPFGGVVVDGTLYGRGAADMKGAIAAFAAAALDFAKAKGDDIPGTI